MKYTLFSNTCLIIGFGSWDGVSTQKENSKLVSIIGYTDTDLDTLKFRTYIFFGLRVVIEKK